ncbi:glycosyltransferase [Telluria sp. B2]
MDKQAAAAIAPGLEPPRLVAHLVPQLDAAGAALLDLIAHMPAERYRHAVLCLGEHSAFHAHLRERGVEVVELKRRAGLDPAYYLRMYRALRSLRPDLVHTRSPGSLDGQLVAALAGVRLRVHGEVARESLLLPPPLPRRARTGLVRRVLRGLVKHFIAASAEQERWLIEQVGAEPARVTHISAGVDSVEFHPRLGPHAAVGPAGFMQDDAFVIGSIGAMDGASNELTLVEAFLRLISSPHPAHQRLRLLIVGDGPMRAECRGMLERAGAAERAWLPGRRQDTAQLMRSMDLMVLPALAACAPDTLLAAMASGLPVVATAVGVHQELVQPGLTGILVPPMSPEVMAAAIADYCRIPEMGLRHGARARGQVIAHHSLPAMARSYIAVYDALAQQAEPARR